MVYLKSHNIYIDYILGLKQYKVKDLVELIKEEEIHSNTENQVIKANNL